MGCRRGRQMLEKVRCGGLRVFYTRESHYW